MPCAAQSLTTRSKCESGRLDHAGIHVVLEQAVVDRDPDQVEPERSDVAGVRFGEIVLVEGVEEEVVTVELRDLEMEKIESLWKQIQAEAEAIAARREVSFAFATQPAAVAAISDPHFRGVIAESAAALGLRTQSLPSGAGHDAQELARIAPIGMIFVPSVGGISHSPQELTRPEDVTNGANVLLQTLLRLDREGHSRRDGSGG